MTIKSDYTIVLFNDCIDLQESLLLIEKDFYDVSVSKAANQIVHLVEMEWECLAYKEVICSREVLIDQHDSRIFNQLVWNHLRF